MRTVTGRRALAVYRIRPVQNHVQEFQAIIQHHQPVDNVQTSLNAQRQVLRSLGRQQCRKVVGSAERNLIHFVRSKAKVSCLRAPKADSWSETVQSLTRNKTTASLFDMNKLSEQISREQTNRKKVMRRGEGQLVEWVMRQAYRQERPSLNQHKEMGFDRTRMQYCGLSREKKRRMVLY